MIALDIHTTVGELVKDRPARSRVFENLGIDYCCGGKRSLAEACGAQGLDVAEVLNRLETHDARAESEETGLADVNGMGLGELADHIERTHHAYLREELPRLGIMVRKVAAVHGDRYPWMPEIDTIFAAFTAELQSHMLKEEQILFPLIRALERGEAGQGHACGGGIAAPISVMEHEHANAGDALALMRELSSGFTPPADACNTFCAMLDGLAQLERDMHEHVHKENNILFPSALALDSACAGKDLM